MGVIQQGINQLIGTAAIAARLSPGFETRQELHKLSKQEDIIQKAREAQEEPPEVGSAEYRIWEEGEKRFAEIKQKQFELNPNPETLKSAANYKSIQLGQYVPTMQSLKLDQMNKDMGQMRAQQKATEQLQQQENFNNFREQIDSDVQDTINILQGKDVPTQEELDLDKKISKLLPNFNAFGDEAKQHIRKQFKEGGNK